MGRALRLIVEDGLYEIVPRARRGLPLPPTMTTQALVSGILGRVQRDEKVELSNFVDMNNHHHMMVRCKRPRELPRFYMEFQKKMTDTVRRLLGRSSLTLWEGRPSVALISGLEDAIERLVYMYCNPAKAGLVDSIDEYPGLNTWNAFLKCEADVDATVELPVRWYPARLLEPLPSDRKLVGVDDHEFLRRIQQKDGTIAYSLTVKPFVWLKNFGISKAEHIQQIRQLVIEQVRIREQQYREARKNASRKALGAAKLRTQAYMKPHTPRAKQRRIYLLCGDANRRRNLLSFFKRIFRKCRECYERRLKGELVEWPPGTFRPWLPPFCCHPYPTR